MTRDSTTSRKAKRILQRLASAAFRCGLFLSIAISVASVLLWVRNSPGSVDRWETDNIVVECYPRAIHLNWHRFGGRGQWIQYRFATRFLPGLSVMVDRMPSVRLADGTFRVGPGWEVDAWIPYWQLVILSAIVPALVLPPWICRYLRLRFRRAHNLCTACGYNLTGLADPRCLECGREFSLPKTMSDQARHSTALNSQS